MKSRTAGLRRCVARTQIDKIAAILQGFAMESVVSGRADPILTTLMPFFTAIFITGTIKTYLCSEESAAQPTPTAFMILLT
jgi:hypothetical protein